MTALQHDVLPDIVVGLECDEPEPAFILAYSGDSAIATAGGLSYNANCKAAASTGWKYSMRSMTAATVLAIVSGYDVPQSRRASVENVHPGGHAAAAR